MRRIDKDLKLTLWIVGLVIALGALFVWAATPAKASLKFSQTWEWDQVPTATSYKIYWSASGKAWCSNHYIEYASTVCANGRCQGDISLPSYSVFLSVSSVNSSGERPIEHGPMTVCLP